MTTMASTSSLRRPRAPVSVMTAAVIVGEKLTTITASTKAIASRAAPVASASTGSQDQASQEPANTISSGTETATAVSRAIGRRRGPRRSTLSVRPAMSAISVVAMPVTTCSWPAIKPVMRFPA